VVEVALGVSGGDDGAGRAVHIFDADFGSWILLVGVAEFVFAVAVLEWAAASVSAWECESGPQAFEQGVPCLLVFVLEVDLP
jgi:hypothetical protein